MTREETFRKIHDAGLLPVLDEGTVIEAGILAKAGLCTVEYDYASGDVTNTICLAASAYPETAVGALHAKGTEQLEAAVKAGASYFVSSVLDVETEAFCRERKLIFIPEVSDETDIYRAHSAGYRVQRFLSPEYRGGAGMIADLEKRFPDVYFIISGGVTEENMCSYAEKRNVIALECRWLTEKGDALRTVAEESFIALQGMTLAHIGVNAKTEKEALDLASRFSLLGLKPRAFKDVSYYMNDDIEIMRCRGRGTNGHIGYSCCNVERALVWLASKGFTPNDDSAVIVDGRVRLCYFKDEIGGFALHLQRR